MKYDIKEILEGYPKKGKSQSSGKPYTVTVAKLIDEEKTPGAYQILWYGKNDNSEVVREGVYFVYIQIGKRVIKKNIIVSKN
ncbi:MAG TPA: hypothetical protein PKJ42_03750 [Candidatus Goldiibacteriota bacterium]|nr:hypothetical protein [Candidatus Goldiibacteriota bacterium]